MNMIIYQLRWVERQDKSERLVSVCNDGRVMEWDLKKGLNCQLLMVQAHLHQSLLAHTVDTSLPFSSAVAHTAVSLLPHTSSHYLLPIVIYQPSPPPLPLVSQTLKRSGDSTGLLSSYAFGLCLAFLPSDPSLYLAGTEDGLVLKCSCSYKEQSLDSMTAHHGPVYALGFSPFHPQIFLTAGYVHLIKEGGR